MIGLNITVQDHSVAAGIDRDVDALIGRFAARISFHFQRLMSTGTRSGRLYRKGGFDRRSRVGGHRPSGRGSRIHRASAPGEPLASDTGKTARSVTVRRLKSGVYRVRVGGAAGYWEIGDQRNAARPTLLPAIEAAAEEIFNGSDL